MMYVHVLLSSAIVEKLELIWVCCSFSKKQMWGWVCVSYLVAFSKERQHDTLTPLSYALVKIILLLGLTL